MPNDPAPHQRDEPRPRIPIRIEEALAALAIAVTGLITFANVLTRYLSDVSLAFTEEYAIMLMVVMTLLGGAVAVVRDHHIRITFFVDRLSSVNRRRAELFAMAATAVVFGGLAAFGVQMTYDEYRFEVTSPGLGVPQWLYSMWLPILSSVITARTLGRCLRILKGAPV